MLSNYRNSFDFFMSTRQIKGDDIFSILHYTRNEQNLLWDFFQKIEAYYLSNLFEYSIQQLDNTIIYREYCNKEEIKVLQFEVDSLHWHVLCACNESVKSIADLKLKTNINADNLCKVVNELSEEGVLYTSPDMQEMVSVINTNICV